MKITQSVFLMDWVISFYVKPHHRCLQKDFRLSGQYLQGVATCPKEALYGEQMDTKVPLMCH